MPYTRLFAAVNLVHGKRKMSKHLVRRKVLGDRIGDMGKPLRDGDGDGKCRESGDKFIPCPPGIADGTLISRLGDFIDRTDGVDMDLFMDEDELEQSSTRDDWQQWKECRAIRQAAYDIVSGKQSPADPYLRRTGPNRFGDPKIQYDSPSASDERFRSQARYLLNRLVENLQSGDFLGSLYRAMELPDDDEEILESLQEGKIVDIPLMATASNYRQGTNQFLTRYGSDLLFKIDGPNIGIDGDALAALASDDDESELLDYLEEVVREQLDAPEDENFLGEDAEDLLQLIIDYDAARRSDDIAKMTKLKKELMKYIEMYDLMPENMLWSGDELPESHSEFYARFEEPDMNPLHEVITGGRYKVNRVETDPTGTYKYVVSLSQVGIFDPRQPGAIIPVNGARR